VYFNFFTFGAVETGFKPVSKFAKLQKIKSSQCTPWFSLSPLC